jgi:hypothetical protein
MPTMKKMHVYKVLKPKHCPYIETVIPIEDREIPEKMMRWYTDITEESKRQTPDKA